MKYFLNLWSIIFDSVSKSQNVDFIVVFPAIKKPSRRFSNLIISYKPQSNKGK